MMYTLMYRPIRPRRRSPRICAVNLSGSGWMPRMDPLRNTSVEPGSFCGSPDSIPSCSHPRSNASSLSASAGSSVVTCVMRARFLTRPQLSPSGVSDGHSIPHWLGCRARGPLTLRVFSNWLVMRVIMPRAEMKERRERTWVTPLRSIRKRLTVQFPDAMACSRPFVSVSWRMHATTSNWAARLALDSTASACRLRSWLSRLKRSSNSSARSCPASSRRLFP